MPSQFTNYLYYLHHFFRKKSFLNDGSLFGVFRLCLFSSMLNLSHAVFVLSFKSAEVNKQYFERDATILVLIFYSKVWLKLMERAENDHFFFG